MTKTKLNDIDLYIEAFPKPTQLLLKEIRQVISQTAKNAEECINYGMPTFKLEGVNLVHFAGYKNHIGFYPTPSAIKKFKEEILSYKNSKGAVQFPLDEKLPINLIKKIVVFRINEIREKTLSKKTTSNFHTGLSAPAQRALENAGIKTLKKLSAYSEQELLKLHGIGPSSIPKLQEKLKAAGLAFKTK